MDEVKSVLLKVEMVVDELNYAQNKLRQKADDAKRIRVLLGYVELFNKQMTMFLNLLNKLAETKTEQEIDNTVDEIVNEITYEKFEE